MGDSLSAADFKSNMDKLFAKISTILDVLSTLKGD